MDKQHQFLMIVQTMFIANAINLSLTPDTVKNERHKLSASASFMFMDDAVYASERIPAKMTASDAAHQFAMNWLAIIEIPHEKGVQWFHRDMSSHGIIS